MISKYRIKLIVALSSTNATKMKGFDEEKEEDADKQHFLLFQK